MPKFLMLNNIATTTFIFVCLSPHGIDFQETWFPFSLHKPTGQLPIPFGFPSTTHILYIHIYIEKKHILYIYIYIYVEKRERQASSRRLFYALRGKWSLDERPRLCELPLPAVPLTPQPRLATSAGCPGADSSPRNGTWLVPW